MVQTSYVGFGRHYADMCMEYYDWPALTHSVKLQRWQGEIQLKGFYSCLLH